MGGPVIAGKKYKDIVFWIMHVSNVLHCFCRESRVI